MRQRLKERLVGAALLALIGVVFIPMLLSGPVDPATISANIPKRPDYEPPPRLQPLPLEAIVPGPGPEDAENTNDSAKRQGMAALRAPSAADIAAEKGLAALQDGPEKAAEAVKSEQGTKTAGAAPPAGRQVGLSAWVVQLGAFDSQEKADQLKQRLKQAGFRAFMEPVTGNTQAAYRVRVGPELLRSEADKLRRDIKAAMKLDGIVLDYP